MLAQDDSNAQKNRLATGSASTSDQAATSRRQWDKPRLSRQDIAKVTSLVMGAGADSLTVGPS
jgi:hypothetical protein